jgi:hypothetical protein
MEITINSPTGLIPKRGHPNRKIEESLDAGTQPGKTFTSNAIK